MTDTTRQDFETMSVIANRALVLYAVVGRGRIRDKKLDVMMDIEHAHDDTPLDLEKFANFDDGNFAHDMLGIRRHMNRQTGELEDCFLPRCAA